MVIYFLFQNSQCRQGLMVLITAKFVLGIMAKKWLNCNVNIYELEIDMGDTTQIEEYAFVSPAFVHTEFLTLKKLNVSNLSNSSLFGFDNLTTLKLYQLSNSYIPSGFLSGVSETLENLVVFGDHLNVYNLSGMTNGVLLTELRFVSYSLNLKNTIDEFSFTGLTAIHTLELSSCGIEVFGERTFDNIAESLMLLKLNNNRIKHFSSSVFEVLLQGPVKIFLDENPLECSCELSDFQQQVQMHRQNFIEIPKCSDPYYLHDVEIDIADMCLNGIDPLLANRYIGCINENYRFEYKPIRKQEHKFRLVQNVNESFTLQQFNWQQDPYVLIVNSSLKGYQPNCIVCLTIFKNRWIALDKWRIHMICIINPTEVRFFDFTL